MPDVAEQPAKPIRTWRPMVLWIAGILLALGLAWFVGAVVVPVYQTHAVVHKLSIRQCNEAYACERLGRPEMAVATLLR